MPRGDEESFVDAWLARHGAGLAEPRLRALLERGLASVTRSACITLGDVTVEAVLERILAVGTDKFPLLGSVTVGAGAALERRSEGGNGDPVSLDRDACRFVLVELLTLLGTLTSSLVTGSLRAALEKSVQASPREPKSRGEGASP